MLRLVNREEYMRRWSYSTYLSGGINDRHQLLQVPRKHGVIKNNILFLEALKKGILLEIILVTSELVARAGALLIKCVYSVRQASGEPELLAL